MTAQGKDISPWITWGITVFSVVLVLVSPLFGEYWYDNWLLSEAGIIENGTVLFLVVAIGFLIATLRCRHLLPREVIVFLCLLLLASVYFAGEEVDWGQVWFSSIQTPERLAEINREGQLNLHKLNGNRVTRVLFNTGPRSIATLCMLAGAILPFIALRRGWHVGEGKWARIRYWLLPRYSLVPACLAATLVSALSNIVKSHVANDPRGYLELALRKPSGEVKEYYIALAIMFYAWSLWKRLRLQAKATAEVPPLPAKQDL